MPSWLSPRVGTVPQTDHPAQSKKDRRSKPQHKAKKGITMEDLKKQTALRLAHEQKKRPPESSLKGPAGQHAPVLPNPQLSVSVTGAYPQQPGSATPYGIEGPPPPAPGMMSSPSYGVPYPTVDPALVPSQAYPVMQARSADSIASHSSHKQSRDTKREAAKLPHGLTVQELKEMTKARLQAEAAKMEESGTLMEHREQPPPPPPVSLLPLQVPAPYVQNRSRTHSRDGWSQASRTENDEYSVCSTTSDFPGSENAMGIGPSPSPSPFAPARTNHCSYGTRVTDCYAGSPLPDPSSVSFGGAADLSSMNRRRAQTLSPRQGFSFVEDDHNTSFRTDFPRVPSYSTPSKNRQVPKFPLESDLFTEHPARPSHMDSRSRAQTYSAGRSNESMNQCFPGISWNDNRPRTSSAASLPAMSHTAEEFFMMEPPGFQGSSFHRLSSDIGVLKEEDALISSLAGLVDDFRKPSPPGFDPLVGGILDPVPMDRYELGSSKSFAIGPDNRHRASTWAPDSMFGTSPSRTSGLGMEELAAILKLSEEDSLQR